MKTSPSTQVLRIVCLLILIGLGYRHWFGGSVEPEERKRQKVDYSYYDPASGKAPPAPWEMPFVDEPPYQYE